MSNINRQLTKEKPMSLRFAEKRTAQETDASMIKEAPDPSEPTVQTPGAIQTHPLEAATPFMDEAMESMEQVRKVLSTQYNGIKKLKETGDASHFLDKGLATNPELWEKKVKEFNSLKNKLLTLLPTV